MLDTPDNYQPELWEELIDVMRTAPLDLNAIKGDILFAARLPWHTNNEFGDPP